MKVAVFGASGGTGTCIVNLALDVGHEVTALVRDPARMIVGPRRGLEIRTTDLNNLASVCSAIADTDAVISAIGTHNTAPTTLRQDSIRSIAGAMVMRRPRRLLFISGSVVTDKGDSFYLRYLLKPIVRNTFLRHANADFAAAEEMVRSSDLDWTIFRPPGLTDKPATGTFRVAIDRNLPRCFSISRGDLAACILEAIGDPYTVRKHICCAN